VEPNVPENSLEMIFGGTNFSTTLRIDVSFLILVSLKNAFNQALKSVKQNFSRLPQLKREVFDSQSLNKEISIIIVH